MAYRIAIADQSMGAAEIDADTLQLAAATALQQTQQPDETGLSITLMDDAGIQALNRAFRSVDAPTDVLSFSAMEGESFVMPEGLPVDLGDVIISMETAARQAQEMGHSVQAEMTLLAVHGTLHLTGMDHSTAEEQARMWEAQDRILASVGCTLRSYVPPDSLAGEADG